MLPCISTFPGKTVLKKIFRGVPSNQSPSAKGTCWWQICISLWFMVIKIWYSTGKSIESQVWLVICCNGTWEELFYFFFIVFLSICLTQVFINSLLTIKVPVLLKKKKPKNKFSPSHFARNIYILLVSLSKRVSLCPLYGLLTLLCDQVPLWVCGQRPILRCRPLSPHPCCVAVTTMFLQDWTSVKRLSSVNNHTWTHT